MKLNPTIWLSYVSYPATTAAYFERALRKKYKVLTCGPQLPEETVKQWDLQEMKVPIAPHDISSGFQFDVRDALKQVHRDHHPDLFLWVESVFGFLPDNIKGNGFPTACYLIDSHLNLTYHLQWAKRFDYVFIAQREYIPDFKNAGINNIYWLPLGCDPEIHSKKTGIKLHDVSFVGSLKGNTQARRVGLLQKINSVTPVYYKRCFLDEMSNIFSESKIVFNNAIKNDLNMRLFEVMSTGTFLLTDIAKNSGQDEMFRDGEDYGIFTDENINEKVKYYLSHDNEREKIASRGQSIIHKGHTYALRLEELIKVTLNEQKDTPSAAEWRYFSETGNKKSFVVNDSGLHQYHTDTAPANKPAGRNKKSFVIPVLDMSPASPYNIEKLLGDLQNIEGDVIVIFNSIEMAEKYKHHPRINYYAAMKENVGVSRAWNIGLNISQTPITFIMNSDLSISSKTVCEMENYIESLPDAAIVGPQGSFFSYEQTKDIMYFDKASFREPFQVDAVSGFLFAVKTELFNSGVLKFDNQYTPCYFEEWDMGLQIRQANLKSYVVPVTEYEHEWSGSIRSLRTIKYLDKEETAGEILNRNRELFKRKWNMICMIDDNEEILVSLWRTLMLVDANIDKKNNNYRNAEEKLKAILQIYPKDSEVLFTLGNVLKQQNRSAEAMECFRIISEKTNPGNNTNTRAPENYFDNPRPDIQAMVSPNAKIILDIGCGSGRMGSALKEKNSAEVWGVELNPDAANKAKDSLNIVYQGRIEDNLDILPEGYFDTIIFADVIEHLVDPAFVLERIKNKLTDEGELIISLPNVRYWKVITNLIQGGWEYEDMGILDRTHLRFFTFSSAANLLKKTGYNIMACNAVIDQEINVPDEIINIFNKYKYDCAGLKQEGAHFQYLFKCSKSF